jgi:putative tryptophan/tyrosine transport system substrate-binding protein
VRRREFIKLLGSGGLWPAGATAQQPRIRQVGVLMSYPESDAEAQEWLRVFVQALEALGWRDGVNLKLHYRWRGVGPEALRASSAELADLRLDAVLAGATPAAIALKTAMQSVPIVFANVADPVGQGLIASLAQPGGNMTGFGAFEFSIGGKWVEGLKELVPSARQFGVIVNPETAPFYRNFLPFIEKAAQQTGIVPHLTAIEKVDQIVNTIEELAKQTQGLVALPGALFTTNKELIVRTVARLGIPAMYSYTFWVSAGGLISYGFDVNEMFQRAANYIDAILKGARVQELPVQHPTQFQLAINLRTARALGITVPNILIARANEVIE